MDAREKKLLLLDSRYLRMTQIWAENSYCRRRQVGALLVKDKMIISDGYNGTPSGFENECEEDADHSKPYVLHAEANAITKVARSNNSSDGASSMSPHHPAWSAASSSSRPASAVWCSVTITACTMAWICCAVRASKLSTCGNATANMSTWKSQATTARATIKKWQNI